MTREYGTGNIRKRSDGRWEARIPLPNGSRKSYYGDTKKAVADQLKAARHDLEAGLDLSADRLTVETFLNDWLRDVVKATTRPKTAHSYASMVRLHIVPRVGHHKLKALRQPHVDAMLRDMTAAGLSARTVQYARAILRAALTYAIRAGMVERNAAQYSKPPARQTSERAYLTAAQAKTLLDTSREHDPDLHPLLTLGLYTGLRIGELAGLSWDAIDFEARSVSVRRTVGWINGAWSFGEPKTKKSARTLTLPKPAIDALIEQRDRQGFLKRAAGERWRPYDLVFASTLGTPIEHKNVSRRLHVLLERAGLPKMGFHGLRHSCASLLVASGIPMRAVTEQLGHSQMSLTSDLYAHVAPDMLRDNADALERALLG